MVQQGYINHVGLVLDASSSMHYIGDSAVKVADLQVEHLAQRSKEVDQETRATVYTFNTRVDCVFYDKDVLRLPSIKRHYRTGGQTALIDATIKAIEDLEQTATLYGDHAFLLYVLTDGQENASRKSAGQLRTKLAQLPDNWTVAVFVPDQHGVHEAKQYGFAPGNIAVWDTSAKGIAEVGETIKRTTNAYMAARTTGMRSTTGLFELGTENLTPVAIHGTLLSVPSDRFDVFVGWDAKERIDEFVKRHTGTYRLGSAFYELVKPETIQPTKQIMVRDRTTGEVFSGHQARQLLNLPNYHVRVAKADHPNYDIFVQSTSYNRNIVAGQEVIVTKS